MGEAEARAETLGARLKLAVFGSDGALGISNELRSFLDPPFARGRCRPDGSVEMRRHWSQLACACASRSSALPDGIQIRVCFFRAAAAASCAGAASAALAGFWRSTRPLNQAPAVEFKAKQLKGLQHFRRGRARDDDLTLLQAGEAEGG